MDKCKICGKDIDLKNAHFILTFNKEVLENDHKKTIKTEKGAMICEECGEEGLPSVLHNLKLIHETDTQLKEKMELISKSINFLEVMKEYGISGEKISIDNQYLAKCPFHNQDSSFLIDADKKEYFCICEGIRGDVFSFVINYDRDVNHKHTTLKQAVDHLMEKFQIEEK